MGVSLRVLHRRDPKDTDGRFSLIKNARSACKNHLFPYTSNNLVQTEMKNAMSLWSL